MVHLIFSLALAGTRPAARRPCVTATVYAPARAPCGGGRAGPAQLAFDPRRTRPGRRLDYVTLSHYRKLDPEYAGRRALAVDEILEVLSEQSNGRLSDQVLRRRSGR